MKIVHIVSEVMIPIMMKQHYFNISKVMFENHGYLILALGIYCIFYSVQFEN